MAESLDTNTEENRKRILKSRKYAPATGIQSDFEKILTIFVETKSVRYEEFAKIFREKKLSLICAGRQSDRETVEFMEECMKVAFRMFLPPYGFQARVGALYLLYGLYMTQPCVPKVKIRVMRGDWTQIKSMQEEFVKQNHHDTNFILHKLLVDGAFVFCAVSDEVRNRYSQPEESSKSMVEVLREDRQRIDDLFSDEIMDQLNLVHNQYHQQKVRLAGPDASRPDRSLDVLHDKFPTSVRDLLQQHHERWKMKEASRQGNRDHSLPTIPEDGESEDIESMTDSRAKAAASIGARRARLKAMAFCGTKNKQLYKHRRLAVENLSSEDSPSSTKKKRGRPRGTKQGPGLQRSTMSTISEQEEENTVVVGEDGLLHMPHFEVLPEDKKPGRKRKVKPGIQSNTSYKKQKITEEEMENELSEEAVSPTKRPRGRPPRPKAGSSMHKGKVGRPPKPKTDSPAENDAMDQSPESKPDTHVRTSKVGRPRKSKPDTPVRTGKVGRPPKPKSGIPGKVGRPSKPKANILVETRKPGKVGRPRKKSEPENKGSSSVESTHPNTAEVIHCDSSEPVSSQATETTSTELVHSQQSTNVEPSSADELVSADESANADEPVSTDELVSTDAPASAKDEDITATYSQQPRTSESQKRLGTDNREDSGGGSKVGRKEGPKREKESQGKGAKLKVTPLLVQLVGKGKKKP